MSTLGTVGCYAGFLTGVTTWVLCLVQGARWTREDTP